MSEQQPFHPAAKTAANTNPEHIFAAGIVGVFAGNYDFFLRNKV